MDGTAIIVILAVAGVASIFLFALKGLLDQIPDVLHSATRARDAWDTFRRADTPPPALPVDESQEPPAAA
ncbi:hypothetical protein [Streptomyces sp. NBC_00286]|uniref:hypothetical protein n=1 Tax=Streptomyces sp. NBC_00286 TaxID=2975701 RepID=UPI002E2BD25A|nr:hypothetical protein [Streptomyces sp. NBC_00286]